MSDVTCEILIDASPATIFPFLVDPKQHVRWMGTTATLEPVRGGAHRLLVGGSHPSAGTFLEVVPNERIVFTFGWDEPDHPVPAGSTEVEIALLPQGAQTLVRLTHRNLPEDAVGDHTKGWTHYLERLAQACTGIDVGPDVLAEAG